MAPEPYEEILFQGRPSWLSTPSVYVRGLLIALVVGVIGGLASAVAAADGHVQTLWVAVAVALVFLRVSLKCAARRARTVYWITDRRIAVRVGLLSRDLHETRLEHVLNVQSRQTLIERLLRIGTVDFDTAAGPESDFCLRGVSEPRQIARAVSGLIQDRYARPAA